MQVLGFSSMKVTARAVARQAAGSTCVYTLNPTASKALWATGTTDLVSPLRNLCEFERPESRLPDRGSDHRYHPRRN